MKQSPNRFLDDRSQRDIRQKRANRAAQALVRRLNSDINTPNTINTIVQASVLDAVMHPEILNRDGGETAPASLQNPFAKIRLTDEHRSRWQAICDAFDKWDEADKDWVELRGQLDDDPMLRQRARGWDYSTVRQQLTHISESIGLTKSMLSETMQTALEAAERLVQMLRRFNEDPHGLRPDTRINALIQLCTLQQAILRALQQSGVRNAGADEQSQQLFDLFSRLDLQPSDVHNLFLLADSQKELSRSISKLALTEQQSRLESRFRDNTDYQNPKALEQLATMTALPMLACLKDKNEPLEPWVLEQWQGLARNLGHAIAPKYRAEFSDFVRGLWARAHQSHIGNLDHTTYQTRRPLLRALHQALQGYAKRHPKHIQNRDSFDRSIFFDPWRARMENLIICIERKRQKLEGKKGQRASRKARGLGIIARDLRGVLDEHFDTEQTQLATLMPPVSIKQTAMHSLAIRLKQTLNAGYRSPDIAAHRKKIHASGETSTQKLLARAICHVDTLTHTIPTSPKGHAP